MAEGRDMDGERIPGENNWLSEWEVQVVDEWQDGSDVEERVQHESEVSSQKLWLSFQNSASSITQLYRDRCKNSEALWYPFQNSASRVTILYKDSVDAMKRGMELGKQLGHQRRTKDILGWLKKKRRHIRREELIAYLCGKSPPPRPRPTATLSRAAACHHPGTLHRGGPGTDRSSPRLHSHNPGTEPCDDPSAVVGAGAPGTEPDLRPFRDALALQRLNGAMSNISMGYTSPLNPPATTATVTKETYGNNDDDDFHCFVLEEITRRCDARKRTSNNDVRMDSPTRKRSRLL